MSKKLKSPKSSPATWQNPAAHRANVERTRSGAAGVHETRPRGQRTRTDRKKHAIRESRDND